MQRQNSSAFKTKQTLDKVKDVYGKREDQIIAAKKKSTTVVDNKNKTQRANPKSGSGRAPVKGANVHYFPSDVGTFSQGHYIIFSVKKQVAANVTGRKARGKAGASLRTAFQGALQISDMICMYMPPQVTLSDNLKYADQEIGGAALAATGGVQRVVNAAQMDGAMKKALGMGKGVLETGEDFFKGLLIDGVRGMANILGGGATALQISQGIVATPHLELMFEGVTRREFTYTFTMTPRNETEADKIRDIVKIFRTAMYPDYAFSSRAASTSGITNATATRYMKFPDVFEIQYYFRGTGENNFLPQPKTCSLTKCDVTYGGGESYVSVGGNGSPQKTTIALSFSEIDIMTKSQVKAGH